MVLYFTGTGNSKYIANLIGEQTGDTTVDAVAHIKAGTHPHFTSEQPYVFVAPVYAWRFPRVFENWIKACVFSGNKNVYFVINCGDSIGAAGDYMEKTAKEIGLAYKGTAEVVMPENYIVMFEAPPVEAENDIIAGATGETVKLCRYIMAEEPFDKVKPRFVGRLCSSIVNPLFYTFYIGAKKFHTTDACISCGKCVDACMLNNITLQAGRPIWGKDCTHCMACISKCPTGAIEYGKHTKGLRRYVCPKEQ